MIMKWYGNAGHLIVSNDCRFHLCTEVNGYIISTVGEYIPPVFLTKDRGNFEEIGLGRLYETMVFLVEGRCECGCGLPTHNGREIETEGYNTPKEANDGHNAMVNKYVEYLEEENARERN